MAYVVELTYMHYIYLAVIVVVIALMILKHDVVVPCIVGLFVLGFCYSGFSVIGGAQAVFNGMMVAGADLFDIMLIIALMVAMLKAMEAIGADKMMIAPAARVIKSPTVAFVVIAVVMYICASFFWPTPATALVGTILIPIAMKAGLKPMMACMAMNLAGHGLALSGDLVLQPAPPTPTCPLLWQTAAFWPPSPAWSPSLWRPLYTARRSPPATSLTAPTTSSRRWRWPILPSAPRSLR